MSIESEHYKENFAQFKFNLDVLSDEEIAMLALGVLIRMHSSHPLLKAIEERLKIKVFSTPEGVKEVMGLMEIIGTKTSEESSDKS